MMSRARRRRQQQRLLILAIGALAVVALIVTGIVMLLNRGGGGRDVPASTTLELRDTPAPAAAASAAPTNLPEPTAAPTPTPVPGPTDDPSFAQVRPEAKEGWLPVFKKAATDEKIIAITVDDCFQAQNLRKIVDTALANNGKLTIFPIGKQVVRNEEHSEVFRYAYQNGMELENHTYTHNGLYGSSDEELAYEVMMQSFALSYVLNVEYTPHFFRPRGGDAHADQRIHAYIGQVGGYKGVAHWSVSGSSSSIDSLRSGLKPGDIYLFHTTDNDLRLLQEFIPYAVSQGYRLVTLNEMFGYPENETKPLTKPIQEYEIPPLQPYDVVPVTYKKGSYAYGVKRIQERLVELGYLEDDPDGIYGHNTYMGVGYFQRAAQIDANGVADPATQEALFSSSAPKNPFY